MIAAGETKDQNDSPNESLPEIEDGERGANGTQLGDFLIDHQN